MYKLIAVDMDGTLLNSNGELTDNTIKTVKKLINKGGIFSISTGRPVQGLKKVIETLGLCGPMITYNGAMIVMAENKKIVFHKTLGAEESRMILDMGRKFGTTITAWSDNKLYANVINDRVNKYKKISNVEPILIEDDEALISKGITKMLFYDTEERIAGFMEELKKCMKPTVKFCTSQPVFLEFFNSSVSKAEGIHKLAEMYNLKIEEIIAVGDGYNDLEMIEAAGLGVCMSNAPDDLKKSGDYIAPSNDDDGVAEVITKFML